MPEDPAVLRTPPNPRTPPSLRALLAGGVALVACLALAACGVPPELREADPTPTRRTPTPTVTPSATALPTPTPTPSPSPDGSVMIDCQGRPSAAQVTALLRRSANLPRNARLTYQLGPLCAADWQYSVVQVDGGEIMHVVSRGPADKLKLVTAGNDVCSIPVRVEAPPAIRSAACDAGPLPTPGL